MTTTHDATIRPGTEGEGNFVAECSCGWRTQIASTSEAYALTVAERHVNAFAEFDAAGEPADPFAGLTPPHRAAR